MALQKLLALCLQAQSFESSLSKAEGSRSSPHLRGKDLSLTALHYARASGNAKPNPMIRALFLEPCYNEECIQQRLHKDWKMGRL